MSSPTLSLEEGANAKKRKFTHYHLDLLLLLPAEILDLILSFVTKTDLVLRVSLANRRLRAACLDSPSIWSSVTVGEEEEEEDWPLELARGMIDCAGQRLRKLVLKQRSIRDHYHDLAVRALRECPRLERLSCYLKCPQTGPATFLEAVDGCFTLRELVLSGSWDKVDSLALASSAGCLRRLTKLHIGGLYGIGGDVMREISNNCGSLESLKICLSDTVTDDIFIHFLDKVRSTIRELHVESSGVNLERTITGAAFQRLGLCPRLEQLGLNYFRSLSEEGLRAITKLPTLSVLSLTRIYTLDRHLASVLQGKKLDQLVKLDLRRSQVNDICMEAISKSCPRLEHVDLTNCWGIRTLGVRSLMVGCQRMRRLDIGIEAVISVKAFEGFSMTLTIECWQGRWYETKEWNPPYCHCPVEYDCRVFKAVKMTKMTNVG